MLTLGLVIGVLVVIGFLIFYLRRAEKDAKKYAKLYLALVFIPAVIELSDRWVAGDKRAWYGEVQRRINVFFNGKMDRYLTEYEMLQGLMNAVDRQHRCLTVTLDLKHKQVVFKWLDGWKLFLLDSDGEFHGQTWTLTYEEAHDEEGLKKRLRSARYRRADLHDPGLEKVSEVILEPEPEAVEV